jgi:hypothetical protein
MSHKAHVAHHVAGRIRIKVPTAKGSKAVLHQIGESLTSVSGVAEIKTNAVTGSVLVHYDPPLRGDFHRRLIEHAQHTDLFTLELPKLNELAGKIEQETPRLQSMGTDRFFYFFLRLRKGDIRRQVETLKTRYPNENPEQLARRLIAAQAPLSFLSGALLHLPLALPRIGQAFQLLGFVSGTSSLTRMHLYLILEIALVFGKDIDDQERVSEMAAIVAATGLASGTPLLVHALELNPLYALPAGGLMATVANQMIGETAIRTYCL